VKKEQNQIGLLNTGEDIAKGGRFLLPVPQEIADHEYHPQGSLPRLAPEIVERNASRRQYTLAVTVGDNVEHLIDAVNPCSLLSGLLLHFGDPDPPRYPVTIQIPLRLKELVSPLLHRLVAKMMLVINDDRRLRDGQWRRTKSC
jgi:hypothetical protein